MMKLMKNKSMGESIQAYAAKAYCSCYNCTDCICDTCYGDNTADEHVFQVNMNTINSYQQTNFNIANGITG